MVESALRGGGLSSAERLPDGVRAAGVEWLDVMDLTSPESSLRPDARHATRPIRRSPPKLISVVFVRHGELGVTQAGREALLGPRDFTLCDDSRPFDVRTVGCRGATAVRAQVPRAVLPLSARQIDRLLATRLPGQEGVGALFTQYLDGLTAGPGSFRTADVARLRTVGGELLAAALAHHLEAQAPVRGGSRQQTLLMSIEAFVREHVRDPDLSAQAIAAAHHISVSYLHRLFRSRATTIAGLIRSQRLEGARRDLTDLRLRDVPVHQIAARWGFKGHAAFTRTFRAAYDIAPRDYRHQTLGAPA
jgi:AraC-like DNA-binding protein